MGVTPGPWKVTTDERGLIVRATDSTGKPIASMWMNGDSMEDNARLIAAAPDMRDALTECRDFFDWADVPDDDGLYAPLKKALAAIAKATGAP